MAKKQKIELNDNPLEAVTIGQIKEHKYSWIITVVIFILFIGIVYFLPDLMRLYQTYIKGGTVPENATTVNNTTLDENTEDEEKEDIEEEELIKENKYKFAEINEVVFNENIKFSNITLNGTFLSFNIINTSNSAINLQNEDLYFEIYSEDNNLINRIALKGTISENNSSSLSYQIKSSADYYEIKQIFEEDYTYIDLAVDENNTSVLTCIKDDEKIIYTFVDEKLKVIEHTVSYLKTAEDYNEKYTEFNNNVITYGSSTGISAGISQNTTSLNYRMKIDYKLFNSTITNEYYFVKDTAPRIVNFKMEALLFECS